MKVTAGIRRVGICGLGQMGAAAAVAFKRGGYEVLAWDRDPARLSAVEQTAASLEDWMERHVGPAPRTGGSIAPAKELAELDRRADLIMDAIVENLEQKGDLLRRFAAARERGATFISTTSGLPITELGRRGACAGLLAGTHFWNPPHLMPLVEVVRGAETPDAVMDRVCEVMTSIGKIPVRVNRDVPGFIGNRMLHALWREAIYLVQEGVATAEEIDTVARLTFALRMPALGPLENMDLVGLDLIGAIHDYLMPSLCDEGQPLRALRERLDGGRLGAKSGTGFYDWSGRDASEVAERRDRQIVRQLAYLRETGGL